MPALQTCARSTTSAHLGCVSSQLSTEQLASGGKALAPVKAVLQAAAARLSLPNVAHLVRQQARRPPHAALQPLQTCLVQRRSPSPLCTFPFPPRQAMPSGTQQLSGQVLKVGLGAVLRSPPATCRPKPWPQPRPPGWAAGCTRWGPAHMTPRRRPRQPPRCRLCWRACRPPAARRCAATLPYIPSQHGARDCQGASGMLLGRGCSAGFVGA